MKRKIILTLLTLVFTSSIFSQTPPENLLENVEIKFTLEGEPTTQAVGFNNPKSYWKVKYELYLTDFSEMEKLGLTKTADNRKYIPPIIRDTSLNKQIKKKSMKISKGNFTKKSLLSEANREVIIPVNLPPEVVEIYNQATKIPEKNPTFVLFITEKISVKDSAKAKLKEKYLITGFSPLKHALSNQNFEYWNVKNMSLNVKIAKQDDGKLKFVGGLVH